MAFEAERRPGATAPGSAGPDGRRCSHAQCATSSNSRPEQPSATLWRVIAVLAVLGSTLFALTALAASQVEPPKAAATSAAARGVTVDRTAPPPSSSAPPASGAIAGTAQPVAVRITAIDVAVPLVPLGLEPDQTIEVPADYNTAGWYRHGPRPGDRGASVIVAHVDSWSGPAAFFRLRELTPGDEVFVDYDDGSVVRFVAAGLEQHPKDRFPTEKVYGQVAGRELRLITCGGRFDHRSGHYRDNVIVYADFHSTTR